MAASGRGVSRRDTSLQRSSRGATPLPVAESRPSAFASKAGKDRVQALQLLEVLIAEAPDGLRAARADLAGRGPGWNERLRRGLDRLERRAPAAGEAVEAL